MVYVCIKLPAPPGNPKFCQCYPVSPEARVLGPWRTAGFSSCSDPAITLGSTLFCTLPPSAPIAISQCCSFTGPQNRLNQSLFGFAGMFSQGVKVLLCGIPPSHQANPSQHQNTCNRRIQVFSSLGHHTSSHSLLLCSRGHPAILFVSTSDTAPLAVYWCHHLLPLFELLVMLCFGWSTHS